MKEQDSGQKDTPIQLPNMVGFYLMRSAVGIASADEEAITRDMVSSVSARQEALDELCKMGVEITDDDRSPEEILSFLKDLDARRQSGL